MQNETENQNLLDRFNHWLKESITFKLFSIGFLVLLLLIPSAWIQSIMEERQTRAMDAIEEVAEKWAYAQVVKGPIMVVPYRKYQSIFKEGKEEIVQSEQNAYFVPERVHIASKVAPQTLHRGIFDVVVYESEISLQGKFGQVALTSLDIDQSQVIWKDIHLIIGIHDLRGIMGDPQIMVNGQGLTAEPSTKESVFNDAALKVKLGLTEEQLSQELDFSILLNLKGSDNLSFLPMGRSSTLQMSGDWGNPSFVGSFLPSERTVLDNSFTAEWKISHFNRTFPQQWTSNQQIDSDQTIGVKLLMPIDQYQKSIRTAKYGILVILLTFISLFMVEISKNIRIHPFQYILIGSALIIYYTLLLSLSEHLGFNKAYGLSSLACMLLIAAYARSFMKNNQLVLLVASLLSGFYGFIYVIVLQQDYALLMGSVGLFIIIAVLMYISSRVNWYRD